MSRFVVLKAILTQNLGLLSKSRNSTAEILQKFSVKIGLKRKFSYIKINVLNLNVFSQREQNSLIKSN